MKQKLDKLVATVVACLILLVPGALSARERRGANLVITLKDGHSVWGELIAVKPDSLLLLSPAQKDESVGLAYIAAIRVAKKSKAGSYALFGFLFGAVGGGLYAHSQSAGEWDDTGNTITGVAVIGAAGGLIGLVTGALQGKDKTIQLDGMSESDRASFLDRLRGKARIRDHK